MIKTIIKCDGREEPFTPNKLNRWGEWAAETLESDVVDWSSCVLNTVAALPEKCTSQELQERLIKTCLDEGGFDHNRMAGRLYVPYIRKKVFKNNIPTVKALHEKLIGLNYMRKLDYSAADYDFVESLIDHDLDLNSSWSELHQVRSKYSLQDRVNEIEYETQQFTYMRMAMAIAEDESRDTRLTKLKEIYESLSEKALNAPTPNYVNLGTPLRGLASCCVYTTNDEAKSLAVGDHIAYMMTVMSAGIGSHINTRSMGDAVRGGVIEHQGRLPYYRALVGAVKANLQNGRGGAATTYYSAYDPEVETIVRLKNPLSTEDKKIRGIDYALSFNTFFAKAAANNEKVFAFNSFTAPDLWDALYSGDKDLFELTYRKYEKDLSFKKIWIDARLILLTALSEAFETGRAYLFNIDEANGHTPFLERIFSSNLCTEIMLPTLGYEEMMDLYTSIDHGKGEVAMCSLAGVNVAVIRDDNHYRKVIRCALLMIDKCIHQAEYPLAHIGLTAKARLSAGIGIVGYAHYLAKKGLKYSSLEGKKESHRLAERHMYFAIEASLALGKEKGNAPWIDKTKWPTGWLPIDTYNKNVDGIFPDGIENQYDWEDLRKQVIANKGIRNSVLIAHMPAESSSKATGSTNGLYPIREYSLVKTDKNIALHWSAPDSDKLKDSYELGWDIDTFDMIDHYAIFQKWTDQGISADLYRVIVGDDRVSSKEMLKIFFYLTRMGLKSRYYQISKITKGLKLEDDEAHDFLKSYVPENKVDKILNSGITTDNVDYIHDTRAATDTTSGAIDSLEDGEDIVIGGDGPSCGIGGCLL